MSRGADRKRPSPRNRVTRRQLLSGATVVALNTTCLSLAGGPARSAETDRESWNEPRIWRPSDHPGEPLELLVLGRANPGAPYYDGKPSVQLTYNGTFPGPTIRMQGNETLRVRLRNKVRLPDERVPVGPHPHPSALPPELAARTAGNASIYSVIPAKLMLESELPDHINGVHGVQTTNLHTHGLHVNPGINRDGSQSDNIHVRLYPDGCEPAGGDAHHAAHVGSIDYAFEIGNVMGDPDAPHPPGTHWYHPHVHGAVRAQINCGMAGFLITEGDVDEALARTLADDPSPDPESKTGPYDYRERLFLIQRTLPWYLTDKPEDRLKSLVGAGMVNSVNGVFEPMTISMRPGAVERWRFLMADSSGHGFRRLMVLRGRYEFGASKASEAAVCGESPNTHAPMQIQRVEADRFRVPVSDAELETAKARINLLALDSCMLVNGDGDVPVYEIADLAKQNPGPRPSHAAPQLSPAEEALARLEAQYRDGKSVRDAYLRPNELLLMAANRAELLFEAPRDARGETYTILAKSATDLHDDAYRMQLQHMIVQDSKEAVAETGSSIILGYITVGEDPVDAPAFDLALLNAALPPVPRYLYPIADAELALGTAEAAAKGVGEGHYRTRTCSYQGWAVPDFPLVPVPAGFADAHPELENLIYARTGADNVPVLLPPGIESTSIDGQKFNRDAPTNQIILVDSAEEWVVENKSISLWGDTRKDRQPAYQFGRHFIGHPISAAEGRRKFVEDPYFQMVTGHMDHPFHMHVNPFWVLRIEVPDERGDLHNILRAPQWMDTVLVPRGGRAVFRSRFPDFTGEFLNHCHILVHEDYGMMQGCSTVTDVGRTNYIPRRHVSASGMSAEEVSAIYGRSSLSDCYRASLSFVDASPLTGQIYPGFAVDPPPYAAARADRPRSSRKESA